MFDLALKCLMKLVRGDAEAVNASGARASPSVKASRWQSTGFFQRLMSDELIGTGLRTYRSFFQTKNCRTCL